MKRLLLPLIAALALPTAVNAENAKYYLLADGYKANWTVPMDSIELCEASGKRFINNKNWANKSSGKGALDYICVKAK